MTACLPSHEDPCPSLGQGPLDQSDSIGSVETMPGQPVRKGRDGLRGGRKVPLRCGEDLGQGAVDYLAVEGRRSDPMDVQPSVQGRHRSKSRPLLSL